jgi:hypothetical protein
MAVRVIEKGEFLLDGVHYPVTRPIQSFLSSTFAPKFVLGDTTKDSGQGRSILGMSDWRGGIGLNKIKGAEDVDRAWWSTSQLRGQGHLVLPALATQTAASGVSGSFAIGVIGELGEEIYAAFGTSVRKYNNSTDSWGSSLHTLPALATDVITVRMADTIYLIFAHTGGYSYTSNGSSWTDDTTDVKYLTFWDDRLWGIDNTGQLWYALTIGAEVEEAQLQLPSGYATDLTVARDASGEPIIYVSSKVGLWAHDAANSRLVATDLKLPFHNNAGTGTETWRASTYYVAGQAIYRYAVGANTAAITIVGPDLDDGLPSDKRGVIAQLIGTHNDLLALTDSATAPGTIDLYASGESSVIEADVGFSHILGWNEEGWEVKWVSGTATKAINHAHVSFAYDTYRLWWAHNERVYHMPLRVDIINPQEVSDFTYAASSTHETPWFTAGQEDVEKLLLSLIVDVLDTSSDETVSVSWGLNYASSWTSLGTITSDGTTTYQFPNSTTPEGSVFRAIRFKVDLARGSTTTLTPDLLSLTMEYRKKLPPKWGHIVEIRVDKRYKDKSAKQLRAAWVAAVESTTLVELTLRDDDGGTRNYWVDVTDTPSTEQTGLDERGVIRGTLVER